MKRRSTDHSHGKKVAAELGAIADRLSHRATEVTTPVYRMGENGLPASEGTGVLFALGEIRFLLTAAHVLEHLHDGGLTAQAGGVLARIQGDVTRLYAATELPTDEDLADIRIVRLAGGDWLATPLSRFLWWDELDHEPELLQRHAFALIGYPWTKQRARPIGTTVEAYAYRLVGVECHAATYRRLRADPEVSLLIGFEKRRTWGPEGAVTAPDLYGASGCGLWRFGRRIREAIRPPRLSAIGIRWDRHGTPQHVRGTRIRPILAAIGQRYPDAQSIIRDHLHGPIE